LPFHGFFGSLRFGPLWTPAPGGNTFFWRGQPSFPGKAGIEAQGHVNTIPRNQKCREKAFIMSRIPVIDEDACIGCKACVEVCPEVFIFSDTLGWAMVMFPEGAPEEKIQEAIDICPVHCIDWVD
jgi:ferredoxin